MSTPAPEPIRLSKVLFERGVARYETALQKLLAHLNEECPLDEQSYQQTKSINMKHGCSD